MTTFLSSVDFSKIYSTMNDLCIGDLAEITGGRLRLSSLPPLGGNLEPIHRIVVDSRKVTEGDVFWGLVGPRYDGSRFAEEAFSRGALGAVVSGRQLEPWAGKFSIEVDDAQRALWEVASRSRQLFAQSGLCGKLEQKRRCRKSHWNRWSWS